MKEKVDYYLGWLLLFVWLLVFNWQFIKGLGCDGSRPIFHVPHLNGIYVLERWFIRLMEGNRQFVTRDPEKARLFYLPHSMHQLELKLYVPGLHEIKPLAIFLRDYMNMIAGSILSGTTHMGQIILLLAMTEG